MKPVHCKQPEKPVQLKASFGVETPKTKSFENVMIQTGAREHRKISARYDIQNQTITALVAINILKASFKLNLQDRIC